MISPLLPLLFLPFLTPACIDWTTCDKTTCFIKYAKRDGLRVFDPEMENTRSSIGIQLSHHKEDREVKTRVSIEVKAAGFEDDDFAAIVIGDKFLAGCYKGTKKIEAASEYITMTSPQGTLDGDIFCCKDVDVSNLNLDFVPVSSARFLTLNYTTSKGTKKVSLPTDFSASLVLESLAYRETVTCPVKSFRKEEIARGDKMDMPYYPLQDPYRGRCGVENHALQKIEGDQFSKEIAYYPVCNTKTKQWTLGSAAIDFSATPLRCVPRARQVRRSCAGKAPPGEILCGRKCGSLDPLFFECPKGSRLYANYDSPTKFDQIGEIRCTERGYEVKFFSNWILLSSQASVQCRVTHPQDPTFSFLSFYRSLAILLGVSIYIILFTAAVIACVHIFSQWATRVEQIGPIRSPYGPVLSSRAVKASNTQPIRDESNRNTPSAQSGRSSKK